MLGIGLDFGTTNSTLAVFDGNQVSYIELDTDSDETFVMPTANYMDDNYTATIGAEALEMYLTLNQGRLIHLEKEELGDIGVTYGETNTYRGRTDSGGDTTVAVKIHARVDKAMPGHLLRGLKRWLGMSGIDTIKVFDIHYNIIALITPILTHIRAKLQKNGYRQAPSIHVGRPIRFESDVETGNRTAIKKLSRACAYAKLPPPVFYPEPLGAVADYLETNNHRIGEHIMAFDFGGGTLDLCIIKTTADGFEIPATHGIPVGGDYINQLVYRAKIFPELGKGLSVLSKDLDAEYTGLFPFRKFESGLVQWQQTYTLNREEFLGLIDRTLYFNTGDPEAVEKITRLRELITWNYSYSVIKAIESAKIALSHREVAFIEVDELDLSVMITKPEFEDIINGVLDQVRLCVANVLEKAGTGQDKIIRVVKTGGSSLIPSVNRILEQLFPGRVVEHNVFKGIAAGLAIANYKQYGFQCEDD